jgi:superfamily II DNA or RNA helicase
MGGRMSKQLRPYQEELIEKIRQAFVDGHKAVLLQLGTGAGKTFLTATMIKRAIDKGNKSWFLCHRRELVSQAGRQFRELDIPHGYIAAGSHPNFLKPVQVCSIQTLSKRIDRLKAPQLIVYDEVHHLPSKSWSGTYDALIKQGARVLGLTATPERLDGKGLGEHFSIMIEGPTVAWLIENGFLSKFKVFAPSTVDTSTIHSRMGDFVKDELSLLMDKPSITGNAVENYIKYAKGKRALCFCVSIAHSKHVVEQFNANGITAAHIDGTMDGQERDKIVSDFSEGRILILSNVEILGEGFDVPAAEAAILLRPTQSVSLHLQQCGRVLRPSPGKEYAVILDHAGNCLRHGLPDDEREWSLEGREKRKKGDASKPSITVRQCKACYYVQAAKYDVCQSCGESLLGEGRKVEEKEGELHEITRERKKIERQEQGKAASLESLIELGKARGYKQPYAWARHVLNGRNRG